jgi:hypothetical protein
MEVRLSRRGAADRPEWHRSGPGSDTGPSVARRNLNHDPPS